MTAYAAYLSLHIIFASIWIGGAFMMQMFAIRAASDPDPARMTAVSADIEFIGMRVLMPSSLLVLIFGGLLVSEGDWSMGTAWVQLGLAAFAFSAIVGAAFLGPESGRIAKLSAEHGDDHPEVARRRARIFLVARIELVILVLIVVDMVAKPTWW